MSLTDIGYFLTIAGVYGFLIYVIVSALLGQNPFTMRYTIRCNLLGHKIEEWRSQRAGKCERCGWVVRV